MCHKKWVLQSRPRHWFMTAILNIISMHQAAKMLRSVKTKKAPNFSGAVFFSPFTRQVGED
jgi:hypothetical protein